MPMPETAMNKDCCLVFWENDIGFSGELFDVKPETETGTMEQGTEPQFRAGILALYP